MGLFGRWFGKASASDEGSGPKVDKGVARLQKKLMNKYVQTLERKRIIRILADMNSYEATRALLGRFTYVTDGSIVDEDEKELVYEIIRVKGASAQPALESFIREEVAIYWALKSYTEIVGEEQAVDLLLECIDGIQDRFDRSMGRLTNLVSALRDYQHPKVLARLLTLSGDEHEEIRFLAVDGLSMFDSHHEAVDAILHRLVDDDETTRLKTFIMDLLLERRWNVKRFRKALMEKIPDTYFVDDTGVVQRRF
jgi:hypothetical protein